MQNNYFLKNMEERISRGDFTYFLLLEEARILMKRLDQKNISYQVYKPYDEASKVILWKKRKPFVSIYEIVSDFKLTHSMILGTLFSHSIKKEMYGDILTGEKNYLIILSSIEDYIVKQIFQIHHQKVRFRKAKFSEIENYKASFKQINLYVPSTRIDVILAKLFRISRSKVEEKFRQKEVILNGENIYKMDVKLKENDTFSVRKYGKFIYEKEDKKKDKYKIILKKYN